MNVSIVEKYPVNKPTNSRITIRPYVDGKQNMGLEKYNMTLFDSVFQEEPIACLETNGIFRYVTGLNEFAPEIMALDGEEQKAAIKRIRETVVLLEKSLASNSLDPADPDFWNKVKVVHPNNAEFWNKIVLRVSNDPIYLDPKADPYDLIKITAIEAGGFSIIAKNIEDARSRMIPVKFYLDKFEDTAKISTEFKKLRNRALAELDKLFNKNMPKLLYIAKVLDGNSSQFKKSTSPDVIYDVVDKFIDGQGDERNKVKAAQEFTDVAALDMETLKLRALVKDGTFYKFIATRGDGNLWHLSTGTNLGRSPREAIELLRSPVLDNTLGELTKQLESYWN